MQGAHHVTSLGSFQNPKTPLIHGQTVTVPYPAAPDNPPPGLFRWHYLQCVLKQFKTAAYQKLPNIVFEERPIRLQDDSDDEEGGEGSAGGWPSATWDIGRAGYIEQELESERQRAVEGWVTSVATSVT